MEQRATVDCLANARSLAPMIAAAAPRIEAERELPAALVEALHQARLFRMLVPRSLGGEEMPLVEYVQVIEEIAKADASTAWCIGQTSVCSTISKCLKRKTAEKIFKNDARGVLAWGPQGKTQKAVVADGSYRLSGSWNFASGGRHATWLAAHATVCEPDGEMRRGADGNPVMKTFVFPRGCASIQDVWRVIGLKGTGSDSYALDGLFVPEDRAIAALGRGDDERREPGPLYTFTVLQLFGATFAAAGLGIARSMLDDFVVLAQTKTPTNAGALLRDGAVIQSQVGVAETQLSAARAFFLDAAKQIWQAACADAISIEQRIKLRMACAHASLTARQVADTAYHAAGATAIFESNPFERRFRDIHTVSQQVQSHFSIFEAIGRHFLGLPVNSRLI